MLFKKLCKEKISEGFSDLKISHNAVVSGQQRVSPLRVRNSLLTTGYSQKKEALGGLF